MPTSHQWIDSTPINQTAPFRVAGRVTPFLRYYPQIPLKFAKSAGCSPLQQSINMPSPWKKSLDARKQPPAQLSRAGRHSQYTSLWFCCECCGSGRPASGGGMTTEIMHCPDSECTHLRCPECSLESNKQKEPKIGCSIDSGLLPNRLSKSRLSNEVTETETPENFKGSLSTTAELQKTQPLHQRRRRPKYKQKNTVPRPKCSKTNAPQVPSQREVFACPFHKKDPHLYNQFVNSHYLVCTQAGWSEIRRLIK